MKRAIIGLAFVTILLSACGSSSSGSTPQAAGATTPVSSLATSSDPASPDASTSADAGGNPVVGADFCAFLAGLAPALPAAGSAAGALAQLTIELTNWIDAHPDQKPRYASDMDDASTASCPDTRAKVVAALGTSSFTQAFE
jgi:hypothetical protein